jgi:hypothetical protein
MLAIRLQHIKIKSRIAQVVNPSKMETIRIQSEMPDDSVVIQCHQDIGPLSVFQKGIFQHLRSKTPGGIPALRINLPDKIKVIIESVSRKRFEMDIHKKMVLR